MIVAWYSDLIWKKGEAISTHSYRHKVLFFHNLSCFCTSNQVAFGFLGIWKMIQEPLQSLCMKNKTETNFSPTVRLKMFCTIEFKLGLFKNFSSEFYWYYCQIVWVQFYKILAVLDFRFTLDQSLMTIQYNNPEKQVLEAPVLRFVLCRLKNISHAKAWGEIEK